jgi:deoxycytidylate deaminase
MKKLKLYIVRIDGKGELRDSRPCLSCFNKLKELGIKKVIYSTQDSKIESKKMSEYHTDRPSFGYKFINNLL